MKKLKKLLGMGMIGLASFLPIKSNAEVNISLDNIFSSRYMFWGMPFSEGKINQTMINMNKGNFTGTLWGNYDAKQKKLNEIDVFADYTKPINDKLNISLGAIYFRSNIENNWENCINWYAGIRVNTSLNPSLTYNKFTGTEKDDYFEGAVSKDFQVSKRITISTSGKLGYNNKAFREKSGFSHLEGNLKFPINLSKKLIITPNINHSKALASDFNNITWGGINLHYDF